MRNSIEIKQPSARASVIQRRTYSRPKADGTFETWEEIVGRVVNHQRWLWEQARGTKLGAAQIDELEELRNIMLAREGSLSGRTLWLGGTNISKTRQISQFNCSGLRVETVHDVVDAMWLLLNGAGVGFIPVVGSLNGFASEMEVELIRSNNSSEKGYEHNVETWEKGEDGKVVWTIKVGDSAEAWAKAIGKLLAGKRTADKLVLDFSEIRKAGMRLRGYGWLSSSDETLAPAMARIAKIMNSRVDRLLTRMDILDILNLLGTTLSSRRSAEIAMLDFNDPEIEDFIVAKKDFWLHDNAHRQQSNNSIMFWQKPTIEELTSIFAKMAEAGGSEPGFVNAAAAKRRSPWFAVFNPCVEATLSNKGLCNLCELNLPAFNGRKNSLMRAAYILSRANYRQTCVNLEDGILQRAWHENNEFIRLCGVGVTGVVQWEYQNDKGMWQTLRQVAREASFSMAEELNLPRSKNVTLIKPSGTMAKILDTTEGIHKPLGKYIFNNVRFSKHDPYVKELQAAGYRTFDDPSSPDAILVTFPVAYENVEFDVVDGKEVNIESAVAQLERYKLVMDNYVDQNCSITVSYSPEEVPEIVSWLYTNWDTYVGVSFLYRSDPTKTAKDLGYLYLPQQVVTKEDYDSYVSTLKPLSGANIGSNEMKEEVDEYEIDAGGECSGGGCPVR